MASKVFWASSRKCKKKVTFSAFLLFLPLKISSEMHQSNWLGEWLAGRNFALVGRRKNLGAGEQLSCYFCCCCLSHGFCSHRDRNSSSFPWLSFFSQIDSENAELMNILDYVSPSSHSLFTCTHFSCALYLFTYLYLKFCLSLPALPTFNTRWHTDWLATMYGKPLGVLYNLAQSV